MFSVDVVHSLNRNYRFVGTNRGHSVAGRKRSLPGRSSLSISFGLMKLWLIAEGFENRGSAVRWRGAVNEDTLPKRRVPYFRVLMFVVCC